MIIPEDTSVWEYLRENKQPSVKNIHKSCHTNKTIQLFENSKNLLSYNPTVLLWFSHKKLTKNSALLDTFSKLSRLLRSSALLKPRSPLVLFWVSFLLNVPFPSSMILWKERRRIYCFPQNSFYYFIQTQIFIKENYNIFQW